MVQCPNGLTSCTWSVLKKREGEKKNLWRNNGYIFLKFYENYKSLDLRNSTQFKKINTHPCAHAHMHCHHHYMASKLIITKLLKIHNKGKKFKSESKEQR